MSVFQDPLLLINQARVNIAEFDEICERFFDQNNVAQRIDVDPDTGNKTYKYVFQAALPERARYICHTCITDMRHVLDQAACIAFEIVTGTPPPSTLYFPITTHPNDLGGRLSKFFPPELHAVFLRLQPYPTGSGYEGGSDILCNLSTAAQNKHRFVPKVGGRLISFGVDSLRGDKFVSYSFPPSWDFAKNELVLGTTAPDGYIEAKFSMALFVALDQAGPFNGRPANTTIREIIDAVEHCVTEIRREIVTLSG